MIFDLRKYNRGDGFEEKFYRSFIKKRFYNFNASFDIYSELIKYVRIEIILERVEFFESF